MTNTYSRRKGYTVNWPKDRDPKADPNAPWKIRYSQAGNEALFYGSDIDPERIKKMNSVLWNSPEIDRLPSERERIMARILRLGIRLEALLIALADGDIQIDDPAEFINFSNEDLEYLSSLLSSVANQNAARSNGASEYQFVGGHSRQAVDAMSGALNSAYYRFNSAPGMSPLTTGTPPGTGGAFTSSPGSLFFSSPGQGTGWDYKK